MLALTRKPQESIIIGNNIEVKILEVNGDQVKLGIEAPKAIPIHRKEIYIQIQKSNKESIESQGSVKDLKDLFNQATIDS